MVGFLFMIHMFPKFEAPLDMGNYLCEHGSYFAFVGGQAIEATV